MAQWQLALQHSLDSRVVHQRNEGRELLLSTTSGGQLDILINPEFSIALRSDFREILLDRFLVTLDRLQIFYLERHGFSVASLPPECRRRRLQSIMDFVHPASQVPRQRQSRHSFSSAPCLFQFQTGYAPIKVPRVVARRVLAALARLPRLRSDHAPLVESSDLGDSDPNVPSRFDGVDGPSPGGFVLRWGSAEQAQAGGIGMRLKVA